MHACGHFVPSDAHREMLVAPAPGPPCRRRPSEKCPGQHRPVIWRILMVNQRLREGLCPGNEWNVSPQVLTLKSQPQYGGIWRWGLRR